MEQKTECKVFIIEFLCPQCKTGKLVHSGMILTSMPPQYPHNCPNCNYNETFLEIYPKLTYEPAILSVV